LGKPVLSAFLQVLSLSIPLLLLDSPLEISVCTDSFGDIHLTGKLLSTKTAHSLSETTKAGSCLCSLLRCLKCSGLVCPLSLKTLTSTELLYAKSSG
jgi:hypothetical protein